jgi:hypothetical protein
MPMDHKAYRFNWPSFDLDLRGILTQALADNNPAALEAYINEHLAELKDPNHWGSLSGDWRNGLENRDVHEYGDYALTRFYDPSDCRGIGYGWSTLSEELPQQAAMAMLGIPIGPPKKLFDPGRYGSYFQTPELVRKSLSALEPYTRPDLTTYLELLKRCVRERCGVYVTF